MIAWLQLVSPPLHVVFAWLTDYYAAATVLLVALALAGFVVRQPVQRIALAWPAFFGLALLLVLCATPAWPRVSLLALMPAASPAEAMPAESQSPVEEVARVAPPVRVLPVHGPSPNTIPYSASDLAAPSDVVAPPLGPTATAERLPPPQSPGKRLETAAIQDAVAAPILGTAVPDIAALVTAGFIFGALLVVAWLVIGAASASRLCRRATAAPDFARRELEHVVGQTTRVPRLLVSRHVSTAAAWGVLRPTILLPWQAVDDRTDQTSDERGLGLRTLLVHEWAHIRRRDLWLLSLSRGLLVVLYAHPLYWFVRRKLTTDQEFAADAQTAQAVGRHDYARRLVDWARQQPAARSRLRGALGIWERPGQLARRIGMLTNDRTELQTECSLVWRYGAAMAAAALVVVLSLVTLRAGDVANAEPTPAAETIADDEAQVATGSPNLPNEEPAAQAVPTTNPTPGARHQAIIISGICVDENKRPIANARLRLYSKRTFPVHWTIYSFALTTPSQKELQDIRSDREGRFRFVDVKNNGTIPARPDVYAPVYDSNSAGLFLVVQATGKATLLGPIFAGEKHNASLELTMPKAVSLTGRITDADGKPVARAEVTASSRFSPVKSIPGVHHAITDADGRYEVADLAPWDGADENYTSQEIGADPGSTVGYGGVKHPDYAMQPFKFTKIPTSVDVTLHRVTAVEGQVVFEHDGKPAAGVAVDFGNGVHNESTKTDARGRYRLTRLPAGKYVAHVKLDKWPVVNRNVEVHDGKNAIDLQLKQGGWIKGRVTELATGRPLPFSYFPFPRFNVVIRADSLEGGHVDAAAILGDGTFTLAVPPGRSILYVIDARQQFRLFLDNGRRERLKSVDVAAGQTVEVDLRLFRPKEDFIEEVDELNMPPLTSDKKQKLSEQAAIAAIRELGGWTKTETIDGQEYVTEVNMVYHDSDAGEQQVNKLFSDEAPFYVRKFPRVRLLVLGREQISDKGLEYLRGMEHLEQVCLVNAWGLTDAGIGHLGTLPNLKILIVGDGQQLTDEALRHLGQLTRLEGLSLDGGRFTDKGLEYAKHLKSLKSLWIMPGEPAITDDGLRHLAGLVRLEELSLPRARITNAGLVHLRGLKGLKKFDVSDTRVTKEGVDDLMKYLPNVAVEGYPGWEPKKAATPAYDYSPANSPIPRKR